MKNAKGFTLIELLIVVGIIGILAAAIIVAITPGERLQEAREATRNSHKQAIAMAVHMHVLDEEYASVKDYLDTGANECSTEGAGTGVVNDACATELGLPQAPIVPGTASETYTITEDGSRVEVKCTTTTGNGCDATTY